MARRIIFKAVTTPSLTLPDGILELRYDGDDLLQKEGSTASNISSGGGSDKGSFGGTADASSLGVLGYITIPYNGTITGWQVIGDITGNCQFDIWKASSGNIPTISNSITGSEKPKLTSQQINSDLDLTTWTTTSLTSGDIVAINLDSASTLTKAYLTVFVTKTV